MITPILAEVDPVDIIQRPEFLWLVAALVGVMLLGAVLFSWIERWKKRQLSDGPGADIKQISSYREMFERGELTPEEYDRIKSKEARRLRNKFVPRPPDSPGNGEAPPVQPAPKEPEPPSNPVE
jgi:hypothetical protein